MMNRRKYLKILGVFSLATLIPVKVLSAVLNAGCEVCKEAWIHLSKFNATRYQFRYIEPTIDLPKVFIYGDSISIGYTEYVRASLEGKADVMRLHVNGSSSQEFIKRMEAFRKALFQPDLEGGWDFTWDVIHFNIGLHDLKYVDNGKLDKEKGIQVSSLLVYENNLHSIIKYLKNKYPEARLIFATTTPVPNGEAGRFMGDELKYNKVALRVIQGYSDIIINDLHRFSVPILKTYAEGPGNVHYKGEGSRLQGIEVAQQIARVINIQTVDCPSVTEIESEFREYEKSNNLKN